MSQSTHRPFVPMVQGENLRLEHGVMGVPSIAAAWRSARRMGLPAVLRLRIAASYRAFDSARLSASDSAVAGGSPSVSGRAKLDPSATAGRSAPSAAMFCPAASVWLSLELLIKSSDGWSSIECGLSRCWITRVLGFPGAGKPG